MACCCCAGSGKAVLQVSAPACESEKAHTHEGSTSCLGERPRARRGSDGELGLSLPHGSGDGSRRERRLSEGNIRPRGRRLSEASVASHHTASSVGEVISFRPGGEAIKAAFDLIDVDGSGSITRLEVQFAMQSLGLATDEQDLMMLMRRIDCNSDGVISLDEFQKVTALRLHLLAQGVAELKQAELEKLREAPPRRHSFLDWRRAMDRALKGFGSIKAVAEAAIESSAFGLRGGKRRSSRVADVASVLTASRSRTEDAGSGGGATALYRFRKGLRGVLRDGDGATAGAAPGGMPPQTSASQSTRPTPQSG